MVSSSSLLGLLAALHLTQFALAAPAEAKCTKETQAVRREWAALSPQEKTDYIAAVECLWNSPSKLNNTQYPGAVTRYADFIATHINYTFTVHLDAIFLPWHRQFVYLYEKALQDECGYKGTQPYWNWPDYTEGGPQYKGGLNNSIVFDGSNTSFGSDGVFTNESLSWAPGKPYPSGTGGGCVYKGPFSGYMAPFQQFDSTLVTDNVNGSLPADAFAHLPHCFARDLNNYALQMNNNYTCIETLLNEPTLYDFQNYLSGPLGAEFFGPHGGGHFAMGGEGSDLFTSPTDPVFFLHHAQVDRMWTIWQAKDLATRKMEINGTKTLANIPPSDPLKLTDYLAWGPEFPQMQVEDLMWVEDGPYCYRYE